MEQVTTASTEQAAAVSITEAAASSEKYFYHVVSFKDVKAEVLHPDERFSDGEYLPAYKWLAQEVGFYPLFLAVGDESAVHVTGYQNQWSTFIGGELVDGKYVKRYRKAGDYPNYVLFAFRQSDLEGVFSDYNWWNIVLTDVCCEREIGPGLRRILFKKSWSRSKWLRFANKDGGATQFVVPELDLTKAAMVWARNKKSAKALRDMGFSNVVVKRTCGASDGL